MTSPTQNIGIAPRTRRTAALSLLAAFLMLEFLNFTGFCYRDLKYFSDQELTDIAVRRVLAEPKSVKPDDLISYVSAQDLYAKNPDCCVLFKWGHEFSDSILFRAIGFYDIVAQVYYRMTAEGPYPFLLAYVGLSACGRTGHVKSIIEQSGPIKG